MKRFFGLIFVILFLFSVSCLLCSCEKTKILNVYNWGQYISDGKYGSDYDAIAEFEDYYQRVYGEKIKVNYTTFDSNEDMYAKIKSGASDYDVIFPSDYMVQRMIDEGLLAKIDYSNIPNYQYIGDEYKNLYFDPSNEYSIPYTYGVLGIIYNANVVDPSIVEEEGWSIFWDEEFAGQILMINNARDAFGISMYDLGLDVNSYDPDVWNQALEHLKEEKSLVQAYVMDEVFNKMESGEASICAYYAGDYFTMWENQDSSVDLCFYQPDITNVFVDCMCIPASSERQELAEIFINFMLSEETALANAEYIYYASPNKLVTESATYQEDMDEDFEILYPNDFDFYQQINLYGYKNLDQSTLTLVNNLWEEMKIESGDSDASVYIICAVIVLSLVIYLSFLGIRQKIRSRIDYKDIDNLKA